jgi:hypothetical protein
VRQFELDLTVELHARFGVPNFRLADHTTQIVAYSPMRCTGYNCAHEWP